MHVRGVLVRLVVITALVAAFGGPGAASGPPADAVARTTPLGLVAPGGPLELLPIQARDRRIVDTAGRDVLLRGANVNSLAEYWQGVPTIPTTLPVTDADWDLMAARGFSVVRLLMTWSRVEPSRGDIDEDYLDQVEAAVDAAASRGIYTVLDMHQDAYSAFISTTDPASCPPGTRPAKGWDGAPAWATRTDGLSTCLSGSDRNSSPAVERAWNNFYDDVDGIRTSFSAAWGAVAARFAGRPEVAGYDILNEPEVSRPAAELQPLYDALLADTIGAIRQAEAGAPFDHVIFVEPAIPAADLTRGLVIPDPAALGGDTTNISASVHNYMESITHHLTLEDMNDLIEQLTAGMGVPNWGGEYGFWNTEPETLATARRYAADEDDHRWGGAWWQWRQSCGDPHAVWWSDGVVVPPNGTSTHLNLLGCPGNVDLGPNESFLEIVGRGYPRAAPGHLDQVSSDIDTGELEVRGSTSQVGGQLVVWTPTPSGPGHRVTHEGLMGITEHAVPGGRIITARVQRAGTYVLRIGPAEEVQPPPTRPPSTSTTTVTTTTTTTSTGPTVPPVTTTTAPRPPGPSPTPPGDPASPPGSAVPETTVPGRRPGGTGTPPADEARPLPGSPSFTG
jgi:endoglycosylceramidase